jgi:TolA-binding protein
VYPDPRVVAFITENFVPIRIDVRKNPAPMDRFGAHWTPIVVVLDPAGTERYRFEGYLPVEDFLAHLTLALGHVAFSAGRWDEAERRFAEVVEKYPASEQAAEALYWRGVARYKAGNAEALSDTAADFTRRYENTSWAKKASVWKKAS